MNVPKMYFAGGLMLERGIVGEGYRKLIRCPSCGGQLVQDDRDWYSCQVIGALKATHLCGNVARSFTLTPDLGRASDELLMPCVRLDIDPPVSTVTTTGGAN